MSDLHHYFSEKWEADDATQKLYLTHDLTPESIVFDVGGYQGDWTAEISRRYDSRIFVFEPIREFACDMTAKFSRNPKIKVFRYGLASRNSFSNVAILGAGSGMFREGFEYRTCEFRYVTDAAIEVLGKKALAEVQIDLMAINIEGGEYDLLRAMYDHHLIWQCREIMVQFHPLWPDSYDNWKDIRNLLAETHEEKWGYPFIWELWRRR